MMYEQLYRYSSAQKLMLSALTYWRPVPIHRNVHPTRLILQACIPPKPPFTHMHPFLPLASQRNARSQSKTQAVLKSCLALFRAIALLSPICIPFVTIASESCPDGTCETETPKNIPDPITKMSNADKFFELAGGEFPEGALPGQQEYEHPLVKR